MLAAASIVRASAESLRRMEHYGPVQALALDMEVASIEKAARNI